MQRLKKNRNMIKPPAIRTPEVLMPRLGTKSGSIRWSRERESVRVPASRASVASARGRDTRAACSAGRSFRSPSAR